MTTQATATQPGPVNDLELYEIPDAMRLLKLSRTVIYEQLRTGRLRSVCQGRRRLIPPSAIRDYITLLESEAPARPAAGDGNEASN
ncbi:helix-turn-helix domain-containing protein [Nonomuraea sp. NPDC049158]|uniref:helix-turn-helix domain-containing protein n=1 Tax=Nonomuraea sp. NPDC049158 TaxID=3155649 RepID=UPI00340C9A78